MTTPARYGLLTPGLSLAGPADSHQQWEREIAPEDLIAIAEAADRLGYHHLTCSEHVGIPPEVEAVRGGRYYDPLSTLGFIAARTTRIRLTTYVLVLGYSHPLEICKRYGTLDRLSGGRLVLGLGVGSLKPEFELLGLGGAEFSERGARGDDALRAIRSSFGGACPNTTGRITTSPASSSIRAGCKNTCRSGSAGDRPGRCAARSSWARGGCRSASGMAS